MTAGEPEAAPAAGVPEFSRPTVVERVGAKAHFKLSASPAECAALARRFDLVAIERLEALIVVKRASGDTVRVDGTLSAEVVQSCVISLQPVPAAVEEEFSFIGMPAQAIEDIAEDAVFTGEEDDIEPIVDGKIDLGEVVAQYLSLSLEAYPVAPGVSLADRPDDAQAPAEIAEQEDEPPVSPFAVLAARAKKS